MLSSKQRAALRSCGNGLPAVFQVGKGGVDSALIQGMAECLAKRELVKLRLLENCPLAPKDVAQEIAQETGADVVQVIGRVVLLFLKKKKDSEFKHIV